MNPTHSPGQFNARPTRKPHLGDRLRARPELILIPLVFIVVAAIWEWAIYYFVVPEYVAPAPSAVARALINGKYLDNALYTLSEAMAGFGIAAVSGIVIGGLIAQFPLVDKTLYPYLIAIQTTPKVAIAPLFIIWFGFGMTSKVVIAATVGFFPVLVNVISGLKATDPDRIELMRSLRATRWQIFHMVLFPSALPVPSSASSLVRARGWATPSCK